MSDGPLTSSFRDPAGFVFRREGRLYRQLNSECQPAWAELHASGLLDQLWAQDLLVRHEEVDPNFGWTDAAWKVIAPDAIPMISYPYEWCFSQLKDAALLMTRVQRLAVDHGMSLRDATALNVQFRNGKPVLIDSLSFEPLALEQPWVAYRQFCEHFLVPLALMSYRDCRLGKLAQCFHDGIPLEIGAKLLPFRAKLRPGISIHILGHAASVNRYSRQGITPTISTGMSRQGPRNLLEHLADVISSLEYRAEPSHWQSYQCTHNYSSNDAAIKQRLVMEFCGSESKVIWDLGANTGYFTSAVAGSTTSLVAIDSDHDSVDLHYRRIRDQGKAILPLVIDLFNPSTDSGWAERERLGLISRGPADTVLLLALLHHLAIGNNLPFGRIASWLSQLSNRAIVEWVPKQDPQVQRLLAARRDIFDDYSESQFLAAFAQYFDCVQSAPIGESGRTLHLMVKR